ncbi:MAG: isoprenyl transferase [Dehalococcoidia bacterium]|nr:isoprenyl transferase [Dehalococcoidia bacterium]MCA9855074.1 isoprenyl transferase [Dehalococcoidia bacterium]
MPRAKRKRPTSLRFETPDKAAADQARHLGDVISPISGGRVPRHVAIIMDGNGRWATQRGLPRAAGHRAGTENIRRVIERFSDHGVEYLTVYAFSTENWSRPRPEVNAIIRLLDRFLRRELENLDQNNIRLRHFGHIEPLPGWLQERVENAIAQTADNTGLGLNICFSYGGRDDLVTAVKRLVEDGIPASEIDESVISERLYSAGLPDPDLVIRTGGDMRVSNFLLWQCAYSELYFTDSYWPDFGREDIDIALAEYGRRKRRFGGLGDESK